MWAKVQRWTSLVGEGQRIKLTVTGKDKAGAGTMAPGDSGCAVESAFLL